MFIAQALPYGMAVARNGQEVPFLDVARRCLVGVRAWLGNVDLHPSLFSMPHHAMAFCVAQVNLLFAPPGSRADAAQSKYRLCRAKTSALQRIAAAP